MNKNVAEEIVKQTLKNSKEENSFLDSVDRLGLLVERSLQSMVTKIGNTREAEEYRSLLRDDWRRILRGY
tara:strand:- start:735 stop:944 length:210 start_codon:yes stop_codon:yes gene_type:complete